MKAEDEFEFASDVDSLGTQKKTNIKIQIGPSERILRSSRQT